MTTKVIMSTQPQPPVAREDEHPGYRLKDKSSKNEKWSVGFAGLKRQMAVDVHSAERENHEYQDSLIDPQSSTFLSQAAIASQYHGKESSESKNPFSGNLACTMRHLNSRSDTQLNINQRASAKTNLQMNRDQYSIDVAVTRGSSENDLTFSHGRGDATGFSDESALLPAYSRTARGTFTTTRGNLHQYFQYGFSERNEVPVGHLNFKEKCINHPRNSKEAYAYTTRSTPKMQNNFESYIHREIEYEELLTSHEKTGQFQEVFVAGLSTGNRPTVCNSEISASSSSSKSNQYYVNHILGSYTSEISKPGELKHRTNETDKSLPTVSDGVGESSEKHLDNTFDFAIGLSSSSGVSSKLCSKEEKPSYSVMLDQRSSDSKVTSSDSFSLTMATAVSDSLPSVNAAHEDYARNSLVREHNVNQLEDKNVLFTMNNNVNFFADGDLLTENPSQLHGQNADKEIANADNNYEQISFERGNGLTQIKHVPITYGGGSANSKTLLPTTYQSSMGEKKLGGSESQPFLTKAVTATVDISGDDHKKCVDSDEITTDVFISSRNECASQMLPALNYSHGDVSKSAIALHDKSNTETDKLVTDLTQEEVHLAPGYEQTPNKVNAKLNTALSSKHSETGLCASGSDFAKMSDGPKNTFLATTSSNGLLAEKKMTAGNEIVASGKVERETSVECANHDYVTSNEDDRSIVTEDREHLHVVSNESNKAHFMLRENYGDTIPVENEETAFRKHFEQNHETLHNVPDSDREVGFFESVRYDQMKPDKNNGVQFTEASDQVRMNVDIIAGTTDVKQVKRVHANLGERDELTLSDNVEQHILALPNEIKGTKIMEDVSNDQMNSNKQKGEQFSEHAKQEHVTPKKSQGYTFTEQMAYTDMILDKSEGTLAFVEPGVQVKNNLDNNGGISFTEHVHVTADETERAAYSERNKPEMISSLELGRHDHIRFNEGKVATFTEHAEDAQMDSPKNETAFTDHAEGLHGHALPDKKQRTTFLEHVSPGQIKADKNKGPGFAQLTESDQTILVGNEATKLAEHVHMNPEESEEATFVELLRHEQIKLNEKKGPMFAGDAKHGRKILDRSEKGSFADLLNHVHSTSKNSKETPFMQNVENDQIDLHKNEGPVLTRRVKEVHVNTAKRHQQHQLQTNFCAAVQQTSSEQHCETIAVEDFDAHLKQVSNALSSHDMLPEKKSNKHFHEDVPVMKHDIKQKHAKNFLRHQHHFHVQTAQDTPPENLTKPFCEDPGNEKHDVQWKGTNEFHQHKPQAHKSLDVLQEATSSIFHENATAGDRDMQPKQGKSFLHHQHHSHVQTTPKTLQETVAKLSDDDVTEEIPTAQPTEVSSFTQQRDDSHSHFSHPLNALLEETSHLIYENEPVVESVEQQKQAKSFLHHQHHPRAHSPQSSIRDKLTNLCPEDVADGRQQKQERAFSYHQHLSHVGSGQNDLHQTNSKNSVEGDFTEIRDVKEKGSKPAKSEKNSAQTHKCQDYDATINSLASNLITQEDYSTPPAEPVPNEQAVLSKSFGHTCFDGAEKDSQTARRSNRADATHHSSTDDTKNLRSRVNRTHESEEPKPRYKEEACIVAEIDLGQSMTAIVPTSSVGNTAFTLASESHSSPKVSEKNINYESQLNSNKVAAITHVSTKSLQEHNNAFHGSENIDASLYSAAGNQKLNSMESAKNRYISKARHTHQPLHFHSSNTRNEYDAYVKMSGISKVSFTNNVQLTVRQKKISEKNVVSAIVEEKLMEDEARGTQRLTQTFKIGETSACREGSSKKNGQTLSMPTHTNQSKQKKRCHSDDYTQPKVSQQRQRVNSMGSLDGPVLYALRNFSCSTRSTVEYEQRFMTTDNKTTVVHRSAIKETFPRQKYTITIVNNQENYFRENCRVDEDSSLLL